MDSTHSAWRSFTRRMSKNDAKSPSVTSAPFAVQPLSPPPSASPSLTHVNSFPSPSMTRNPSITSLRTLDSVSESGRTYTGDAPTSPKKKRKSASRASRMMRRMSSGMSSIASITRTSPEKKRDAVATVQDVAPPSQSVRPPPLDLGDLNVQFPDNLLWKRRWVSIDSAGFMTLQPLEGTVSGPKGLRSVSNSSTVSRDPLVSTKRFHMTEFWAPFAPDLERRELNHSIVLDLKDGRCLQYACSGVGAQVKILRCKFLPNILTMLSFADFVLQYFLTLGEAGKTEYLAQTIGSNVDAHAQAHDISSAMTRYTHISILVILDFIETELAGVKRS